MKKNQGFKYDMQEKWHANFKSQYSLQVVEAWRWILTSEEVDPTFLLLGWGFGKFEYATLGGW